MVLCYNYAMSNIKNHVYTSYGEAVSEKDFKQVVLIELSQLREDISILVSTNQQTEVLKIRERVQLIEERIKVIDIITEENEKRNKKYRCTLSVACTILGLILAVIQVYK